MGDAERVARAIAQGTRSIIAIPQLSDDIPDSNLETEAYAVQRLLRAGFGDLIGWKLGVTSRAKQVQVGRRLADLRVPGQRPRPRRTASRCW